MSSLNKILKEIEKDVTDVSQSIKLEYKAYRGNWEKGSWEVMYQTGPFSWYSLYASTPLGAVRKLKLALERKNSDN